MSKIQFQFNTHYTHPPVVSSSVWPSKSGCWWVSAELQIALFPSAAVWNWGAKCATGSDTPSDLRPWRHTRYQRQRWLAEPWIWFAVAALLLCIVPGMFVSFTPKFDAKSAKRNGSLFVGKSSLPLSADDDLLPRFSLALNGCLHSVSRTRTNEMLRYVGNV